MSRLIDKSCNLIGRSLLFLKNHVLKDILTNFAHNIKLFAFAKIFEEIYNNSNHKPKLN